jgi:hypothetical protein
LPLLLLDFSPNVNILSFVWEPAYILRGCGQFASLASLSQSVSSVVEFFYISHQSLGHFKFLGRSQQIVTFDPQLITEVF